MKVSVLSYSWGKYAELSSVTFVGWHDYCKRHGYDFITDWQKAEDDTSWQKPKAILKHLPSTDLLFWVDCDTVVTNPFIKVDDLWRLDGNSCPITISADCYGLNAGVMLLANVPITEMFFKAIDEMGPKLYPNSPWDEQEAVVRFAHTHPFQRHVTVIRQNAINSYLNAEYGRPASWPGSWQYEDFIIHFPGLPLERRIELAKEYSEKAERYVGEREHRTPRPQSEQT